MAIEPADLLQAARELNDSRNCLRNEETCARTIANRAYYAAYLATREAIEGTDQVALKHRPLAETLRNHADPNVAEIGDLLDNLRALRTDSDYRPRSKTIRKMDASLRIRDAATVIESIPAVRGKLTALKGRLP